MDLATTERQLTPSIEVREERAADSAAIRAVNQQTFDGGAEAHLVDRLRADGDVVVSLVATSAGRVVGHILFSRLPVETEVGRLPAAALAPMAVLPAWQRQGIGSDLVRKGLATCRDQGIDAVAVLGHPGFYPRFGFSAELARRLVAPYRGDAFMAVELVPGALAFERGEVIYPPAFAVISASAPGSEPAQTSTKPD